MKTGGGRLYDSDLGDSDLKSPGMRAAGNGYLPAMAEVISAAEAVAVLGRREPLPLLEEPLLARPPATGTLQERVPKSCMRGTER